MVWEVFPEKHCACIIGCVTILKGAIDGILQDGSIILERFEQMVDVVIVFHTAALVS